MGFLILRHHAWSMVNAASIIRGSLAMPRIVNGDRCLGCCRRNNGQFLTRQGVNMDSRWLVPHNRYLCAKYDAHISVRSLHFHCRYRLLSIGQHFSSSFFLFSRDRTGEAGPSKEKKAAPMMTTFKIVRRNQTKMSCESRLPEKERERAA